MYHPHIWLHVNTLIFLNIHVNWIERARDMVHAALWELHACPAFPINAGAADGHGFVTGFDDPCPCPHVDSQPGVEGQAAVRFPRDVIVNAGERSVFMMFFP